MTIDRLDQERKELVKAARREQPEAVRRLPDSFPLSFEFDPDLLARELAGVSVADWGGQRTATGNAIVNSFNDKWRVLALRSVAGDPNRTDAGGAEQGITDWTPHISHFPVMRAFLNSLPLELQAVRLMALEPGGRSPEHVDSCVGLSWGRLRLHVPLVTSSSAHIIFDGKRRHWDRQLWYGSFSLPHYIENRGTDARIHLVIDGVPERTFIDLLPPFVHCLLEPDDVLVPAPFQPAAPEAEPLVPVEFDVPAHFLSLSASARAFTASSNMKRIRAERITRSSLALIEVSSGSRYILLRTGHDMYRILGWPHKSVSFFSSPFGMAARLSVRVGPSTHSRVVKATAK